MKRTVSLIFAIAVLFSSQALAQDKRVAVLELRGAMDPPVLALLSDKARAGILDATRGKGYIVMSRENMVSFAKEMEVDLACVEGECEVETGRNLGATYVVSGSLLKMGEWWLCTIKIHNTDSGALLATDDARGKDPMELLSSIRTLSKRLMQEALGEPVTAAVAPAKPAPAAPKEERYTPPDKPIEQMNISEFLCSYIFESSVVGRSKYTTEGSRILDLMKKYYGGPTVSGGNSRTCTVERKATANRHGFHLYTVHRTGENVFGKEVTGGMDLWVKKRGQGWSYPWRMNMGWNAINKEELKLTAPSGVITIRSRCESTNLKTYAGPAQYRANNRNAMAFNCGLDDSGLELGNTYFYGDLTVYTTKQSRAGKKLVRHNLDFGKKTELTLSFRIVDRKKPQEVELIDVVQSDWAVPDSILGVRR